MRKKLQPLLVAGVDEAGRGPLAGPVVAAAVILDNKKSILGLMDSKILTSLQREKLFDKIINSCISYAYAEASVEEIDHLNILRANLLAMKRAVEQLAVRPSEVLVDGRDKPELMIPTRAIIGGDQTISSISAASIVAKVVRDKIMINYDKIYPDYGFADHKGYPTSLHQKKLKEFGPCPIHRHSFAPVRESMAITEEV